MARWTRGALRALRVRRSKDAPWNNDALNPAFGTLRARDYGVIEPGFR
jgi:hypothetical protein